MKLSEWAKSKGITYKTAYRMFKSGKLPVEVEQLPTGTIIVFPTKKAYVKNAVLYARVSSHDQKEDLKRQMDRLRDYAAQLGLKVKSEISEIGSGLNGNRKKLNKILADSSATIIVVEHRDRLARFGVEMLSMALSASGRSIIVLNETEFKDDIVQDFVDLITSMCARIYGKRAAKNKAQKALQAIENENT